MEEWEYLEGHKDLYKDVMMDNQPPLTSPDGSSHGNPPERCPRPLYSRVSAQRGHTSPHHHQGEEIKVQIKRGEQKTSVSGDQQSMEKGEMITESKQEEPFLYIDINGHYVQNMSKGHQILSQDYKAEDHNIKKYSPRMNLLPQNRHHRPRHLQTSMDPSNPEESSDRSHTMTSDVHLSSHSADRSTATFYSKISSSSHEGFYNGESSFSFSCSVCGKSFTNRAALLSHQKSHFSEGSHSCSECGKSFTSNADLLTHHRIHTGIRPFRCSECGVCYSNKRYLHKHMKIHTGEGFHRCSECGKCFSQKGLLLSHQKVHTG